MIMDLRKICKGYEIGDDGRIHRLTDREIERMAQNYEGFLPVDLVENFIYFLVGDIGSSNERNCHRYIGNIFTAYRMVEDSLEKAEGLLKLMGDNEVTPKSQKEIALAFEDIGEEYVSTDTLERSLETLEEYRRKKGSHIRYESPTWDEEKREINRFNRKIEGAAQQMVSKIINKISPDEREAALNLVGQYFSVTKEGFRLSD